MAGIEDGIYGKIAGIYGALGIISNPNETPVISVTVGVQGSVVIAGHAQHGSAMHEELHLYQKLP